MLIELFESKVTILTPTRRLAARLGQEANTHFSQTQSAWASLAIFALDDWLNALWDQFEILGKVQTQCLTLMQSLLRWEVIIADSESGKNLLQTFETAKMAFRAWKTLHEWLSLKVLEQESDELDHQAFQSWAHTYATWLAERGFTDGVQRNATLLSLLTHHVQDLGQYLPHRQLCLYGFEEFSPFWQTFFATLQHEGWIIQIQEPAAIKPHHCVRMAFQDERLEWQTCAEWAIAQKNQHKSRIGIIVPNLPDKRQLIAKIFYDRFSPLSICQPVTEVMPDINISAAIPLNQYPIIDNAMELLKNAVFAGVKAAQWGQWAEHIRTRLAIIGWPGEKPLNSIEHQVLKRWDALLIELSLCDSVLGPVIFSSVMAMLKKLAANTPFQPESKQATVHILGVLEAAGQSFDALWVCGLHAQAWPPKANPNPFIPYELQRDKKMPHASAEREMEYAKKVTERFQTSAVEVIFSYPLAEGEQRLLVSELIRTLPLKSAPLLDEKTVRRCEDLFTPARLEPLEPDHGPKVLPTENIKANATLLTLQAACPFKAFAEIRLQAKREEPLQKWLTPAQRGTLLHRILELFWQEMNNQKSLLERLPYLESSLESLIQLCIERMAVVLSPAIVAVEKSRLKIVLQDYLALECERPAFTVLHSEMGREVSLQNMTFRVRLDRIDQDQDGNTLIIDYKTGKFKITDLFGTRPKAPQLGLYYLATQEWEPKALFATKLVREGVQFEGIAQHDLGIKGVKPPALPWESLYSYWKEQLGQLVQAFQAGQAQVDPLEGANTCQYCDLQPFCRIHELKLHKI